MKILNVVSAKVWGGGEQYVYDISCELSRRNIDNFILVDNNSEDIYLKFLEITQVYKSNLNVLHGFLAINNILALIDKFKIDIINVHSGKMVPLFMLIKKLRNVKIVLFKHNSVASKNDIYHKYIRANLDAIVCVSKLVYDLQTMNLCDQDKLKFHLIYNGIYTDKFDKYNSLKKNTNNFIIGYAGRIAYNKGIDLLLNAVKVLHDKYCDIELKIVGQDEKNYLKEVCKFIDDNEMVSYVKYNGFENDMEKFYKSIDLFVLPSRAKESFGLVLCEAMYCGVPVITSNSGAQCEIIENGKNGFIIDNELNVLIETIEGIYNKTYDIENIKENAKKVVVNKFTINNTVDKLNILYSNI